MALEYNAKVIYKNEITPSLMILRIAPMEGSGMESLPEFKAGQYCTIGLQEKAPRSLLADKEEGKNPERWIKRAYSIASSSRSLEYVELYITMVYSGSLTPRLFALREGDPLWLGPKFTGHFTLQEIPEEAHVVFMATGTGLAPYMSMLRSQFTCGLYRKFVVLHGARHSWDLGYRSELTALQRECHNFAYIPIIDFPQDEITPWAGETGYVQDLWKRGVLEKALGFKPLPENTHILLCGNPLMVESSISMLKEMGFKDHTSKDPGQIHVEKYW